MLKGFDMLGTNFTKINLLTIFSVFCIFTLIPASEAHILIIGDSKGDYPTALQETQALAIELKSRGYNVLELYQDEATTKNILKGMYDADAIIYAGHGGYQSGNYNNGGIAKDPFALVGSDDFIWGIGSQMREGWNGELFYAPFKSNIPVILLHACFSTGWVGTNEVSNPIETIYDFSNMFTSAGANYYATAWNGAEIVYDFLNGASTFQEANQINNEEISKENIYNSVSIWRNDHGYAAFVGNWLGTFPTASQTTPYDDAQAELWYNGDRLKNQPKVTSSSPVNNAVNVPTDKVIKVYFSEPVQAGTLNCELKSSSGKTIPLTKSVSGNVLTITPSTSLARGTSYNIILHTGSVTDLSGNPLALKTIHFTTDGIT
jgi:Bacterial Ig-like domain